MEGPAYPADTENGQEVARHAGVIPRRELDALLGSSADRR
jgi:hypothetical protein